MCEQSLGETWPCKIKIYDDFIGTENVVKNFYPESGNRIEKYKSNAQPNIELILIKH